ncbi:MAG: tetratricopeptide repeat protein, partial [Pseudomonadales bacterium]|nr:tetratricopeptide repeat protein [Pseudomonadales bacterium]
MDQLVSESQALIATGDLVEAERLLNTAIETDPRHEGARFTLARVLAANLRFDEALAVLSPIPSRGHDEKAALLAEIQLQQAGDVDIEALQKSVEADSSNLNAAIALGKALGAKDDYERPLEILLAVVKEDATFDERLRDWPCWISPRSWVRRIQLPGPTEANCPQHYSDQESEEVRIFFRQPLL